MMEQYSETIMNDGKFGEAFRYLRKSRGLKLKDAAALTGLSIGLISDIERGERAATLRTIQAFVTAYNAPMVIRVRP